MTTVKSLSYEEFLEWADEDTWAEWEDGEVVTLSPANLRHQLIKTFLMHLFGLHVEQNDLGIVLDAPFQMRLRRVKRGREPDILFIAHEHLDRITSAYLDGPADLVVEIISPDSIERDREAKFREYEAEGVREYWLIDPDQQQADFFVLGAEGRYAAHLPDGEGSYHSVSLDGFAFPMAWLWQTPLPSLKEAVQALDLLR